jgi:hypothetical protein
VDCKTEEMPSNPKSMRLRAGLGGAHLPKARVVMAMRYLCVVDVTNPQPPFEAARTPGCPCPVHTRFVLENRGSISLPTISEAFLFSFPSLSSPVPLVRQLSSNSEQSKTACNPIRTRYTLSMANKKAKCKGRGPLPFRYRHPD